MEIIALVPIGYPVPEAKLEKKREPVDQLVHWNKI